MGLGPGQPGGGAPALLPEDLGDGGVVVVPGEAAHQVQGVLAGHPAVLAGPGQRHGQLGTRAALPDDPQAGGPFPAAAGRADGDDDLGDEGAEQLLALHVAGGRRVEHRSQVRAGGGDPGGFLLGQGDRAAGLLGGELAGGGPRGGEPGLQGGLQGPGDQPVLRLHVVVLAPCPVGFEAGAFGGALEHRQVLAVAGLGRPGAPGRWPPARRARARRRPPAAPAPPAGGPRPAGRSSRRTSAGRARTGKPGRRGGS